MKKDLHIEAIQPKTLKVRKQHAEDRFHASIAHEGHWGAGDTIAEAVYDVILYHPEVAGILIEIDNSAVELQKRKNK